MRPTRREFLRGASGCATARFAAPAPARRPNVIILITDDQGYGDLSLHGNEVLHTPNLDRIGAEGVQFTQFHVSPVCSPTRSSLMTGRYNYRTGVVDTYLGRSMMHSDETTLAEIFRDSGYRTGIFGKWHLGDNYPMRSIDQGFEESLVHNGGGIGQPSDPPGNRYFNPVLQHNGKPEMYKGYCTDIFTEAAIRFIEQHRRAPFFAYIATNAPHDPLEVEDRHVLPFRRLGVDDTTAKVYAMVRNIDENAGRLLTALKKWRLEQNTILLFLTDNGPQRPRFNANMRGTKGTVYQGGIRVPCFLRWPGSIRAGSTIRHAAAHIDILPTLLDACSVDMPAGLRMDGRNLMPLVRGEASGWEDRALFFQWHRGDEPEPYRNCAVRTERYKLVDGKELYDLEADPRESSDISPGRPGVVAELRRRYEEWLRDVSATRGYAPPRIHLGTDHENPVILTRQDWRGPHAGWDPGSRGHWEVKVARTGAYDATVRIFPAEDDGTLHFTLGNVSLSKPAPKGTTEVRFPGVALEAGDGRLEAYLSLGRQTPGARYVEIRRL
jgi:arylsulfatase A-like enzyme